MNSNIIQAALDQAKHLTGLHCPDRETHELVTTKDGYGGHFKELSWYIRAHSLDVPAEVWTEAKKHFGECYWSLDTNGERTNRYCHPFDSPDDSRDTLWVTKETLIELLVCAYERIDNDRVARAIKMEVGS